MKKSSYCYAAFFSPGIKTSNPINFYYKLTYRRRSRSVSSPIELTQYTRTIHCQSYNSVIVVKLTKRPSATRAGGLCDNFIRVTVIVTLRLAVTFGHCRHFKLSLILTPINSRQRPWQAPIILLKFAMFLYIHSEISIL